MKTKLTCFNCKNEQFESVEITDKYCWQCENCKVIIENDNFHLLQETAKFTTSEKVKSLFSFTKRNIKGEVLHNIINSPENELQ